MPSAFTHYWQRQKIDDEESPKFCTQAFSSSFAQRGVATGDRVFFISYYDKRPFLVGAITVSSDPVELDDGAERITANPGSGSIMDFKRAIPLDVARQIIRSDTGKGWKFVTADILDSQTLRGVQRISAESAALFDSLLGVADGAYDDTTPLVESGTNEALLYPDEVAINGRYIEGAVTQVLVNRYERDPAARKACLAEYGCVCAVCHLNFTDWYGDRGAGFIHVHHIKPISEIGASYRVDPLTDLIPVCPNCHAMLHRNPPISVEELHNIYNQHLEDLSNKEED